MRSDKTKPLPSMILQVYFEVPIVVLSLSLWVTKLSQIYGSYVSDNSVETSIAFFMLQLLLTTLWIINATMTMQWLVLITTSNGFFCQLLIVYFLYKTKQRKLECGNMGFVAINTLSYEDLCALKTYHNTQNNSQMQDVAQDERIPASAWCPQGLMH